MNRLCNACNGQLGRDVDEEFMRTGEIGFQRALYGVRGRREHNQVNPFQYRAMSAQQPTTMLTRIPQFDHPILMEGYRNDQGNPAARPLRQVVVRTPEGRIECIPFPRAWTGEQLRKTLEMQQLANVTLVKVLFEDDEGAPEAIAARTLLREVFGSVEQAEAFMGVGDREVRPISLAAEIRVPSFRAIAKIGVPLPSLGLPALHG